MKVYLVVGFDVGGNSGRVVQAVFLSREKAEAYAHDPEKHKWNRAMWGDEGAPFDVEEHEVEDMLSVPVLPLESSPAMSPT